MSEETPHPLGMWGTPRELEVRRRIQVSVAAYAYEVENSPVMSDDLFDWFAERICKRMGTGHPLVDEFFVTHFSPMTGMWIHQHPELAGIQRIYTQTADAMREYFSDLSRHGWTKRIAADQSTLGVQYEANVERAEGCGRN